MKVAVRNIRDLLKHCKDKGNPKWELDGVFVSGNKLICTDTHQLLVLEFKEEFTCSDQPVMLFEDLPGVKSERPADLLTILDANGCFLEDLGFKICVPYFEGWSNSKNYAKIPQYAHIVERYSEADEHTATKRMKKQTYSDIVLCECVKLRGGHFKMKYLYKFLQLIDRAEIKELEIMQAVPEKPLAIKGTNTNEEIDLVSMIYVIMPICGTQEG